MTAIAAIASVQARIGSIEQRLGLTRPTVASASNTPLVSNALGVSSTDASTTPTLTTAGGIDLSGSFESVAASVESALQGGSSALTGTGTATGTGTTTGTLDASTPYADLFERAGQQYGIEPKILAGVGYVESRFQTDVVSSAGAVGMMQFMPSTATAMGVDPRDPASAIDGAARYLRAQIDRFGSVEMALGAYNVGPGAMANAGSVQPGTQADKYVTAVLAAAERV